MKSQWKQSVENSHKVVRLLREQRGMALKAIGKLIGRSESFISLVGGNKRNFTFEDMVRLETALGTPLPLLMLEAIQDSVPPKLKNEYKQLREILMDSGRQRAKLAKKLPGKKAG